MGDEIKWLTTDEAADIVGVTNKTIRRWILLGRLRGTLLSNRNGYRINRAELDRFLSGEAAVAQAQEALKTPGKTNAQSMLRAA